jgi:hypothetical protein
MFAINNFVILEDLKRLIKQNVKEMKGCKEFRAALDHVAVVVSYLVVAEILVFQWYRCGI